MSVLAKPPVQRVASALSEKGIDPNLKVLDKACRTPDAMAKALSVDVAAIIRTDVCVIGRRFVLVCVSGNRKVQVENLAPALSIEGDARAAAPEHAKAATGFPAVATAPCGMIHPLPMLIDVALKKPETLYFPAGDPSVVMAVTPNELKRLTGAIVSYNVASDGS